MSESLIKCIINQINKTLLFSVILDQLLDEFKISATKNGKKLELNDFEKISTFKNRNIEIEIEKLKEISNFLLLDYYVKVADTVLEESLDDLTDVRNKVKSSSQTLDDVIFFIKGNINSRKKLNAFEYKLTEEEFKKYIKFNELEIKEKVISIIGDNCIYKLLLVDFKDFFSQKKENVKYKFISDVCRNHKLEISDVTFDKVENFVDIFFKFKNITFNNCIFKIMFLKLFKRYINQSELDKLEFYECKFNTIWEHISSKSILYSECEFTKYKHNNICEIKKVVEDLLFFNCSFDELQCKGIHFKKRLLKFNNTFGDGEEDKKKIDKLELINCVLSKELKIKSFDIIELNFSNTTFENKCKIVDCDINNAIFQQTKFKDLAGFDSSSLHKVNFRNTRFLKLARFNQTKFINDVNFDYTYFNEHTIFNDAEFHKKINFEKAFFQFPANFLNIKKRKEEKYNIEVENRETARIIKDSFEQKNNTIDANRFYALEMQERENELKFLKNPFEWLTFRVHSIASNRDRKINCVNPPFIPKSLSIF